MAKAKPWALCGQGQALATSRPRPGLEDYMTATYTHAGSFWQFPILCCVVAAALLQPTNGSLVSTLLQLPTGSSRSYKNWQNLTIHAKQVRANIIRLKYLKSYADVLSKYTEWICIAQHHKQSLIRYRVPYFGTGLRLTSPHPDTSQRCETTDTGDILRDVTIHSPSFHLHSLSLPTEGWARLS